MYNKSIKLSFVFPTEDSYGRFEKNLIDFIRGLPTDEVCRGYWPREFRIQELPEELMLEDVQSSNIAQVGYLPTSKVLDIVFKGGSRYRYFDVPEEVYRTVRYAESVGKAFNTHIKGVYEYNRL